jgi:redox-sensitive bicupin YhaK (pirin superfamily)
LVKVISGTTSRNTKGPINIIQSQQNLFIIELDKRNEFRELIAANLNTLLFVYEGELMIKNNTKKNDTKNNNDTQKLLKGMLAVLDDGDELLITTTTSSTKCMLMSAPPLNEAVARGGPLS